MSHKLRELIIDPQSGEYSMSRLCLGALVLDTLGLSLADVFWDKTFTAWGSLALIVGSVAGVYAANTTLRVWRGRVIKEDKK